ncbi:MAG TPA: hypothetical protein VKA44_08510, partial [Gemmatimonadota bacterium]|nr:hypothetical protein [Gemmatimonadota bacterium]
MNASDSAALRPARRVPAAVLGLLLLPIAAGAGPRAAPPVGPGVPGKTRPARTVPPPDSVEALFDSVRYLSDQLDVTRARVAETSIHGVPVDSLLAAYGRVRPRLVAALARVDTAGLGTEDRAALERMRRVTHDRLGPGQGAPAVSDVEASPDCDYDAASYSAGPYGGVRPALDALTRRVFACYGKAAGAIVVGQDTLDRLTIFGLLGSTGDRARRERLFRALGPVWRSVNGDDGPGSPYRRMVALRREAWGTGPTPMDRLARGFGIDAATAERWLVRALEAWRRALPDTLVEPWDYYRETGAAARRLSAQIPRDSLLPIVRRFYRSLGADPDDLGIHYDLEPRAGKYPISYTTFGARPVRRGGRWVRAEPWVFAAYRTGGFSNLAELLHETGHGVHIASIRARPAFDGWPDSDVFTEGIADLAALEAYEPSWQEAFLGDSVPLAASLRSRYGAVMLDLAWSLFEIRVHRPDAPSPNAVWTEITRDYLGIRPHPELSWWAMRGQLVDSPGYMLTYALGAFLVADLRSTLQRRYGDFADGDPAWYGRVQEGLYRYGHALPAAEVTRRFLGRDPTPEALLEDLGRIGRAERPAGRGEGFV